MFDRFNFNNNIKKALISKGYEEPTPVQEKAIPVVLEGKDLICCAQTGTGKTAAFALPIIELLGRLDPVKNNKRRIKALVITPTRELAQQVSDSFRLYGANSGLRSLVVYGGVSQRPQTDKLRKGIDVLIATPGRLLDLIQQGHVKLSQIKILVLDEADRMLDMGFINDIRKILTFIPVEKQTLFFSATMPEEIIKLSSDILKNPVKIEVTPEQPAVEAIKQQLYYVSKPNKKKLLVHLLKEETVLSALVFTRTKHGAEQISRHLNTAKINSEAIHSNKSQNARQRALNNFKSKQTRVLVATDIASRGIDIHKLSHVINYDIPEESETYIHRIGRTGRAGLTGTAVTFCDTDERKYLKAINRLIRIPIPVITEHPFLSTPGDIKDVNSDGSAREAFRQGGNKRRHNRSDRRNSHKRKAVRN
jgi:ATP-dependent RNA helicase RhlE